MNIKQVLITLQKRALILLVVLVAALSVVGYYAWQKHQTNHREAQQNLNLNAIDPKGTSVAFLARYGSMQGNEQQQKDLVAKYGTASFIKSYKPVEVGSSDAVLCGDKPLTGVSIVDSQPYNKYTLNTMVLKFRDGSSVTVDVEIDSQTNSAKINSVTCPRSHDSSQPPHIIPGTPGKPAIQITQ